MSLRFLSIAAPVLFAAFCRADDPAPTDSKATPQPAADSPQTDDAQKPEDPAPLSPLEDEAWLNDPFTVLQQEMQQAAGDLDKGRTRPPAKVTQPLIITRLDVMIEMLERECNGSGGGGRNPTRPANASTLRTGPDSRGEMRAPKQDGRKWAELTAKEREKILQSKTDGFPAEYDAILSDYFRRLSRPAEAPGKDPAK